MSDTSEKSDWGEARPAIIPRPTIWPAGVAFGTTLLMWGLVTSMVLILVGLGVLVISVIGWIGELRHEKRRT